MGHQMEKKSGLSYRKTGMAGGIGDFDKVGLGLVFQLLLDAAQYAVHFF
jgi:hypothetical protein